MTAGQQPGESDREYLQRLAREGRNQKRIARDRQTQDSLDAAADAARERRLDASDDADLDAAMKDLLGVSLSDIQKEAAKGTFDDNPEVRDTLGEIAKQQRKGNTKKATKIAKKNRGAMKDAAKTTKKNKGCAVIAVALLGAGGGVLYGLFEAGHALVSALGH
jgi:hypothetical protein